VHQYTNMSSRKAAYSAQVLQVATGGFHIMLVTRFRAGAAMGPHESYEVAVDPDTRYASPLLGGGCAYNVRRAAIWREVEAVAEMMAPR
jgi:hypothetical protein